MNKIIYADNAATTRISKSVFDAMKPYLTEHYGNPSSIYSIGRTTRIAIEKARQKIASAINASPTEIYFTSGGTEADNWAIKSIAEESLKKGKNHIITTNFEHHAVLHTCNHLEKLGFEVTYLPINNDGFISVQQVLDAITDKTFLVSVMYANNEIGTIQPVAQIGEVLKDKKILFHTDAVQAIGHIDIDVKAQNIDMLSISGHKIHAPKGVGVLYVKQGIMIKPFLDGGAQERNKRGSTENVASIVGLGQAVEDCTKNITERELTVKYLRDTLADKIISSIEKTRINGSMNNRLSGNLNVSIEGIEGEAMLLWMDMNNICVSSGSACTTGSLDPSHVLLALGLPHEIAHGSIRITLNEDNTLEDIEYISKTLKTIVEKLRKMSPVWNG